MSSRWPAGPTCSCCIYLLLLLLGTASSERRSPPIGHFAHWAFQAKAGSWDTKDWPGQCKDDLYVYVEPLYADLHSQFNMMILGMWLARTYGATYILPDWYSNYAGPGTPKLCNKGSAIAGDTVPDGCTIILEFGDLWDQTFFTDQMVGYACLARSSAVRREGLIPWISKLGSATFDIDPLPLLDTDLFHNPEQVAARRAQLKKQGVQKNGTSVLMVKANFGQGKGYMESQLYKMHLRMRLRASAFLRPTAEIRKFSEAVITGALTGGLGFDAIHVSAINEMPELLRGPRDIPDAVHASYDSIAKWMVDQDYVFKAVPLYLVHDIDADVPAITKALTKAGIAKVMTSKDFSPQLHQNHHSNVRAVVEWAVLLRASLFVGNYRSPFSYYMYERRSATALLSRDYVNKQAAVGAWKLVETHTKGFVRLKPLKVCLWTLVTSRAYGGSSHFMKALGESMKRMGHLTTSVYMKEPDQPELVTGADVHILNQNQYNDTLSEKYLPIAGAATGPAVVFRTDGPFALHRGRPKEDAQLFGKIHAARTTATIYQSEWSYVISMRLGLKAINPVLIINAADPTYFFPLPERSYTFSEKRKCRIVTSVMSRGPRKNFEIHKFLDSNLDFNRFELYLVGHRPPNLEFVNAKYIPPINQDQLAGLLRIMDIFLAPSFYECFSNSEMQALTSGMPVLAYDDSSHPEVIGMGGLTFMGRHDIMDQLERMVANYKHYVEAIKVPHMDDLALQYLQAAKLL